MWISEQRVVIFLHSINCLVLITEMDVFTAWYDLTNYRLLVFWFKGLRGRRKRATVQVSRYQPLILTKSKVCLRPVHVEFVVDKVLLEVNFLGIRRFCPVITIPPLLYTHLLLYNRSYSNSAIDSVVK